MATIVCGSADETVAAVKAALDAYERQHPGAQASVMRQAPSALRVRVVDDRAAGMSRSARHDHVWGFLSRQLSSDTLAEVWQLLVVPRSELRTSLANLEFEEATTKAVTRS